MPVVVGEELSAEDLRGNLSRVLLILPGNNPFVSRSVIRRGPVELKRLSRPVVGDVRRVVADVRLPKIPASVEFKVLGREYGRAD